jgi:hypothetical protein
MKEKLPQCIGAIIDIGELHIPFDFAGIGRQRCLYTIVHILLPVTGVGGAIFPVPGVAAGTKGISRKALCPQSGAAEERDKYQRSKAYNNTAKLV